MPTRFLPTARGRTTVARDRWGLPIDVAPDLEVHLLEWLRVITWGLGGLWTFFALVHPLVLPAAVWRIVSPFSTAAGVLMFAMAWRLRRPTAPQHAHWLALGVAIAAGSVSMVHLAVSGEGWQTTNLMLVLVGAGILFASTRAFVAFSVILVGVWAALAPGLVWQGMQVHFGFALGTSAFLAALVQLARRRTTIRSARARLREQEHRSALLGAVEALRESEMRAQALIDTLPDMLVSLDEDGVVADAHIPPDFPSAWLRRQLQGARIEDLLPPLKAREVREAIGRAAASGRVESVEIDQRVAGVRRGFELRVVSAAPGALVLARDVTERVRREAAERTHVREALRVTTARLEAVISAIPILVVAFDADGRVTLAEGSGLSTVTRSVLPTDLLGAGVADLSRDLPGLGPALQSALSGIPANAILPIGDFFWEARLTPVLDNAGAPAGAVAVVVDVTQREAAETALREAKEAAEAAARLRSSFLANMSHEIRTPMAAILGFAELISEELPADQTAGRHARYIRDGGRRLLNLLNNILDLSRIEADRMPLTPTPHRLSDTVDHVCGLLGVLANDKGIALRADVPADLWVDSDPAREEQVLTNVVGNAIRFTEHGSVLLSAGRRRETTGDRVVIEVTDTGIGIAPEFLPQIFDEFRQESEGASRSHEGSGLGLAIARRLVERMGGTIGIRSRKGEGTTVTITLPAAAASRPEP